MAQAGVSLARQPRSIVKVNGTGIAGLKGWSWDGNTMFMADTFSAAFALNGLIEGNNAEWFASQTGLDVEILAGFPQDASNWGEADLESIFSGRVDEVTFAWERGELTLTGRDLTAALIDAKTSEKYPNLTSSAIVTKLAGQFGLTPVVTATKTKVGAYYTDTHTRLQDDRTAWDLVTFLARQEGFVAYVQGKELHFEPPSASGATYALQWTPPADGSPPIFNGTRLGTMRTLTVAKDIKVTVKSWNAKSKKAFSVFASRKKKGSGHVQEYVDIKGGLTPEQAQQRANQLLAEYSRHEMKLSFAGPADNDLTKVMPIVLSGTGTDFDQTYFPDSIARTFSQDGGYAWTVSAKNHSPESQANL